MPGRPCGKGSPVPQAQETAGFQADHQEVEAGAGRGGRDGVWQGEAGILFAAPVHGESVRSGM